MLSGITIDVPCPAAHRRTRFRSTATRCSTRRSYRRSLRGTLCPRITRSPMGHLLSAIGPSRRSSTRPFRAVRPRRNRRRRQHRLLGPVLAKGRTRSVLLVVCCLDVDSCGRHCPSLPPPSLFRPHQPQRYHRNPPRVLPCRLSCEHFAHDIPGGHRLRSPLFRTPFAAPLAVVLTNISTANSRRRGT